MLARDPTEATEAQEANTASPLPSDVSSDDDESVESSTNIVAKPQEPKAKRFVSEKQLEHLKKIRELANEKRLAKFAKQREEREAEAARKAAIAAKEKALADQKARKEQRYMDKLDKKLAKPAKADRMAKLQRGEAPAVQAEAAAQKQPTVASTDSLLAAKIAELERQVLKLKYKSKYARTPPAPTRDGAVAPPAVPAPPQGQGPVVGDIFARC